MIARIDFEYVHISYKHEAYPEAEGSRPGYISALSAQPSSNPGIKTWAQIIHTDRLTDEQNRTTDRPTDGPNKRSIGQLIGLNDRPSN